MSTASALRDSNIAAEFFQQPQEKPAYSRPSCVLEAFETIVAMAENSKFSDKFFADVAPLARYAGRKLKMPPRLAILLALFVDRGEDSIRLIDIAHFVGCTTTRMFRMAPDIQKLVEMRYVRCARSRHRTAYRVPREVLETIAQNRPYVFVREKITNTYEFFDMFRTLLEEHGNDELPYNNFFHEVNALLDLIPESRLVRELNRKLGENFRDETMLFLFMAHLFVENSDDNIRCCDIEDLYDNTEIPRDVKNMLHAHTHELFHVGLIQNVNNDGMIDNDGYMLTDYAKDEVLAELNLRVSHKSDKSLERHDAFVEKQLFYSPDEQKQVDLLADLLTPDRFDRVQKRLAENGMRPGFCCIFYGAPGTGKTETVYQLARRTGRDILRVDVDKVKSCWVGESEKNIKRIFNNYRGICENADLKPILLFNEADAVLGVRMEGAQRAVDKMENSIQNIILQEMEALDGIMIATTNLTSNLDRAFERRFLYKIRFDRPDLDARTSIWQSMMPALDHDSAAYLAQRFDLSGGEIENIVRKQTVEAILTDRPVADVDAIAELCRHERITSAGPRVGF